jgi:hypothetical protein
MPPKRDMVVKDGDTIKLGDEALKVYLTPGHSPGSLTMLIPVKDKGQPRLLVHFGGVVNPLMLPETRRSYDAFEKSFARLGPILESAKVDGYIAAHTNYDAAAFKIEVMRHNPATLPNPFLVGTARVVLFTKMSRECNLNNADPAPAGVVHTRSTSSRLDIIYCPYADNVGLSGCRRARGRAGDGQRISECVWQVPPSGSGGHSASPSAMGGDYQ